MVQQYQKSYDSHEYFILVVRRATIILFGSFEAFMAEITFKLVFEY